MRNAPLKAFAGKQKLQKISGELKKASNMHAGQAKKIKTKMKDMEMASMKTPSYPSGHSVQGILIANVLADKYPNKRDKLKKMGRDISYSRRSARAHFLSDSRFGEQIGNDMYNNIKNKI